MTKVVLPSDVVSELFGCTSRTPLCSQDGVVIGFFEPAISRDKKLYEWLEKEVTTEELEAAAKDGGHSTTDEIFAKLRARAAREEVGKGVAGKAIRG